MALGHSRAAAAHPDESPAKALERERRELLAEWSEWVERRRSWETPEVATDREVQVRAAEEKARRLVNSLVPGLHAWITGGSYYSMHHREFGARDALHPERRKHWAPLVAARRTGDVRAEADAARALLRQGLEQRCAHRDEHGQLYGGLCLSDSERRTCAGLARLGSTIPSPAVCDDCGLVFRPLRKAAAAKCDTCHHTPRPFEPPALYRAVLARRTFDSNGDHKGWKRLNVAFCSECGCRMEGKRGHAMTCSSTCRWRRHQRQQCD